MKRIPLRGRDGQVRAYALVDDADLEFLSGWRWSLHSDGYAYRKVCEKGRQRNVFMHRLLMGCVPGDGLEVDHRNRCRLDCRRENLRVVPKAGNAENLSARAGSSRFRGVSARNGRWRATFSVDRVHVHVGVFDDELEAALAVDRERRERMPYALPDPELERALA